MVMDMWNLDPVTEYELKQHAYTGFDATWKDKDEWVRDAWREIVKENEELKKEIKNLKEELKQYKEGKE